MRIFGSDKLSQPIQDFVFFKAKAKLIGLKRIYNNT